MQQEPTMQAPIPLQGWIDQQTVGDEMRWKGSFGLQMSFIRDILQPFMAYAMGKTPQAQVISTHRSKSILLPVVRMERPEFAIVIRNNFYNWKLSVISKIPIMADFTGLFHTTPPIDPEYTGDYLHPVYFEGFPGEVIFGYYEPSDKKTFSAELYDNHMLFTTIFLMLRSISVIQPLKWHTQASHRAELDKRFPPKE